MGACSVCLCVCVCVRACVCASLCTIFLCALLPPSLPPSETVSLPHRCGHTRKNTFSASNGKLYAEMGTLPASSPRSRGRCRIESRLVGYAGYIIWGIIRLRPPQTAGLAFSLFRTDDFFLFPLCTSAFRCHRNKHQHWLRGGCFGRSGGSVCFGCAGWK